MASLKCYSLSKRVDDQVFLLVEAPKGVLRKTLCFLLTIGCPGHTPPRLTLTQLGVCVWEVSSRKICIS